MMGLHTEKYLVGFSGWRRKCLLFTLSLLLVVVVINMTLTVWMVKVLYFSRNGLGAMKIVPAGIQLRGDSLVMDKLIASKIVTRKGNPIQIESPRNITVSSTSVDGRTYSKLFLGDDRFEMSGASVKISDENDKPIFTADKREILLGADVVRITTEGGTVVHGSVQTPLIRPDAGQSLRLESPTRNINVFALHGINMESRAGDISVQALNEFKIQSNTGALKFESPDIYLTKMPQPAGNRLEPKSSKKQKTTVYQVCVCGKGRLFLAPPEGPCIADNDVCR